MPSKMHTAVLSEDDASPECSDLVKTNCLTKAKLCQAKSCPVTPARTSARLAKTVPEFKGLADDFVDGESSGQSVPLLLA